MNFTPLPPKGRAYQKDSSLKNMKNKESQAFVFDAQRLQRIHLRTLEMLNQYFQKIDLKCQNQDCQKPKRPSKSNISKMRQRFFSLSSDNQQLIAKSINQMKLIYKDVFRSEELKELEKKLRRVKTSSTSLDKEIKLYEQHLVNQLRDMNLQGNDWVEMNMNTKIKQEWRKRNQEEVHSYKLNNINAFFHRNITTDFESQKKRILSNIKKLRLQTQHFMVSRNKMNEEGLFSIGEQLEIKPASDHESKNKFVEKAWNPSKYSTASILSNHSNIRKHRLFRSQDENKKILERPESKKSQGETKILDNFVNDEQFREKESEKTKKPCDRTKVQRSKTGVEMEKKWPDSQKQNNLRNMGIQDHQKGYHSRNSFKSTFHTQKTRELNLRLQKDKTVIQQSRQAKKLFL